MSVTDSLSYDAQLNPYDVTFIQERDVYVKASSLPN